MQTICVLRKALNEGYLSTYRFGETPDGRFVAVSNTGKHKDFVSRVELERAVAAFVKLGYATRTAPAKPVHKSATEETVATPATEQPVAEELNIAPY